MAYNLKPKKYYYCEYLFMGEPKEKEMKKQEAIKAYNEKKKALSEHSGIAVQGSFVGVKEISGKKTKWIKK